jgi:myo-inositol-1(or 4)-monophosphatase
MENPNLNEIHDFLVALAFKAGDIINNALPETSGTGSKMNSPYPYKQQKKERS